MATYTTNYNLEKPEASDQFGDFRQSYNDNMDIIDANLGGGGGGGGHTIVDENGSDMPAESKLQFTGNVSVSDDNVNGATVVDILGGGGNVYGAFVDPSHIIKSQTVFVGSTSYTATEDCFVALSLTTRYNASALIKIDGVTVQSAYLSNGTNALGLLVGVKKGQTLSVSDADNNNNSAYTVYGITQGTNGIFAPVIYSDNERVIGVWRDNKPLYQKTIEITQIPNQNTQTIAHGIANIDRIVDIRGICYARTDIDPNYASTPLPRIQDNSTTANLGVDANRTNIVLKGRGTDFASIYAKVTVTLQYTKTTDIAGSGNWNTDGVPTVHYSTNEQVIGTWIDGKPLYQKTLTHSGALVVDDSFSNDIGSLSSVDQFIDCEGYFRRTNANGLMYSLNGGTRPEGGADSYKVTTRFYNGNVQVAVTGYSDIEYIALTVRYTKTTD